MNAMRSFLPSQRAASVSAGRETRWSMAARPSRARWGMPPIVGRQRAAVTEKLPARLSSAPVTRSEATFFATPADFRAWLERHHETAKELLVGFYKRGTGKPSI